MASLLSNLVNNLSEGIHGIKCKCRHGDKKCKTCGIISQLIISLLFSWVYKL